MQLRDMAASRPRYGYRRLHSLPRHAGRRFNQGLVYRGLTTAAMESLNMTILPWLTWTQRTVDKKRSRHPSRPRIFHGLRHGDRGQTAEDLT
jgi:chloramphenicol O-acetyltransferase